MNIKQDFTPMCGSALILQEMYNTNQISIEELQNAVDSNIITYEEFLKITKLII